MPTYNDPRHTYDHPGLTYNGLVTAALTGASLAPSGTLTLHKVYARALTGAQDPPSATLARPRRRVLTLTGTQLAFSATLADRVGFKRALAGAQLAFTATLAARTGSKRALAGAALAPTASLLGIKRVLRALTGTQLPASASYAIRFQSGRLFLGVHPSASGALAVQRLRLLAGTQPPATGQGTGHHTYYVSLTGTQPSTRLVTYNDAQVTYNQPGVNYNAADPGNLHWRLAAYRSLAGTQPYPTGAFTPQRRFWPWASYWPDVYDRPEDVGYRTSIDADDHTVRYETSVAGAPQGVTYRVRAPIQTKERRG